ncbi:hypothetical protein B0H16DRAFT_1476281 [Mycena metata]|uniref:Uncharacterized protein n=1 Tax=Mycena metata TaxID=1033252 RepID=A0AAD7HCV6_9AGAR|nr:hypothetical protein B0H16DRAFT_1476281 [Mycena metata]
MGPAGVNIYPPEHLQLDSTCVPIGGVPRTCRSEFSPRDFNSGVSSSTKVTDETLLRCGLQRPNCTWTIALEGQFDLFQSALIPDLRLSSLEVLILPQVQIYKYRPTFRNSVSSSTQIAGETLPLVRPADLLPTRKEFHSNDWSGLRVCQVQPKLQTNLWFNLATPVRDQPARRATIQGRHLGRGARRTLAIHGTICCGMKLSGPSMIFPSSDDRTFLGADQPDLQTNMWSHLATLVRGKPTSRATIEGRYLGRGARRTPAFTVEIVEIFDVGGLIGIWPPRRTPAFILSESLTFDAGGLGAVTSPSNAKEITFERFLTTRVVLWHDQPDLQTNLGSSLATPVRDKPTSRVTIPGKQLGRDETPPLVRPEGKYLGRGARRTLA